MRIELLLIFFFLVSCSIRQEQEDGENFFLGEESDEIFVPNITDNNEQPDDVTEEEDFSNLEDKTALFKGTYTEPYANERVACGNDLISFPDHSLVMKFNIGNKAFSLNNLFQYFKPTSKAAESSLAPSPLSGLDIEAFLENQMRLKLPFWMNDDSNFLYVDWGDGTCAKYDRSVEVLHEYSSKGMFTVRVIGKAHGLGGNSDSMSDLPGYDLSSLNYRSTLYEVVELGDLGWGDLFNTFGNAYGLRKFNAKHTDTSKVNVFGNMFNNTKLKRIDLSHFNFESLGVNPPYPTVVAISMFGGTRYLEELILPKTSNTVNDIFAPYSLEFLLPNSRLNESNLSNMLNCGAEKIRLLSSEEEHLGATVLQPKSTVEESIEVVEYACKTSSSTIKYCHHEGIEFSNYPQPLDYVFNERNKIIQFKCDAGYIGGGTLSCDSTTEKYVITEGTLCEPLSCANTSVENSNFATDSSIAGKIGDVVQVECDEGYWGGGPWTCLPSRSFSGKRCQPVTYTQDYAKNPSACDFNGDGENDKFPDHSMVLEYSPGESNKIKLPLSISEIFLKVQGGLLHEGGADVFIDWGDNQCSRVTNDNFMVEHTYSTGGEKTVKVIGEVFSLSSWHSSRMKDTSMRRILRGPLMMSDYGPLLNVVNLGDLKTKSLKNAFIFEYELTGFNTHDLGMKYSNVSSVVDFSDMFNGVGLDLERNSDGGFDNGINFNFNGANMSSGIDFSRMFFNAAAKNISFLGSSMLNGFNFSYMFKSNGVSTISFDENNFMPYAIEYEGAFSGELLSEVSIPSFSGQNTLSINSMFESAIDLTKIDLGSNYFFSNIEAMSSAFKETNKLTQQLDYNRFDTRKLLYADSLFESIVNTTTNGWDIIDIDNFDFSYVLSSTNMFYSELEEKSDYFFIKLPEEITSGDLTNFFPITIDEEPVSAANSTQFISCEGGDEVVINGTVYPCFSECSYNNGVKDIIAQEGEVVKISCPDGFDLSASVENITCLPGGFDREDILCIPKACSQNIAFGANISSNFGDEPLVISCNEGYTPNVAQVTCLENGKFDHEVACIKNGATFTEGYASNEVFKCNLDNDDSSDDVNVVFTDKSFVQVLGGLGENQVISLPNFLDAEESYEPINYYVDWGDGNCSYINEYVTENFLDHTYESQSDKTIRIIGVLDNWSRSNENYSPYLKRVINLGDVSWRVLSSAFQDATNLESFSARHTDTSQVLYMNLLFKNCNNPNLTSLDLSNFDTEKVINMSYMFDGASSLENLDISNFSYANVITYTKMFGDTNFTSLDLGIFRTQISGQDIFTGSNINTSNSRDIISCDQRNGSGEVVVASDQDGDATNGYDIIVNSVRYPCKTPHVTCELPIANLYSGESISTTTESPTINLECADGYSPTTSSITCLYDSSFAETLVTCQPKICDEKPISNSTSHTSIPQGAFSETESLICDSDNGYVGSGEWTCDLKDDGSGDVEWQGQACELAQCNFAVKNSVESVISIVHGSTATVTCLPGFVGGGEFTCNLGVESGTACTDESTDYESPSHNYIEENFHCDLNNDGVEDLGELIDFPDHSFVATFVVHENDGLLTDSNPEEDWKVKIPSTGSDLDYFIDWGDGTCERVTDASPFHSYESSSRDNAIIGTKLNESEVSINTYEYTVRIIGTLKNLKGNNSLNLMLNYKDRLKSVVSMGDVGWNDLSNAFYRIVTEGISLSMENINTEDVTNMSNMFALTSNLESLSLNPVNGKFDTSNVTSMYMMFRGLSKLENLDLDLTPPNKFDTSKVKSMGFIFDGLRSLRELNLNLTAPNKFDTSNVTNMTKMFASLISLNELNLNLDSPNKFNTSKVTNMHKMFHYLENISELDLNLTYPNMFDTSIVTSMVGMFEGNNNLTKLNLGGFVTSNVEDMEEMFEGTSSLIKLNLGDWNLDKITDQDKALNVFENSKIIDSTDPTELFCTNTTSQLFPHATTENNGMVTCAKKPPLILVYETTSVDEEVVAALEQNVNVNIDWGDETTEIGIVSNDPFHEYSTPGTYEVWIDGAADYFGGNSWTENLIHVRGMGDLNYQDVSGGFSNLESLKSFSGYSKLGGTSLHSFFASAKNLESVNFSQFDTSNITDMGSLFLESTSIKELDFTKFPLFSTANVTSMNAMFSDMYSLEQIDLSTFDTTNVVDMISFLSIYPLSSNTSQLKKVNLGMWELDSISIPPDFDGIGWFFDGQEDSADGIMNSLNSQHVLYCENTDPSPLSEDGSDFNILFNNPWANIFAPADDATLSCHHSQNFPLDPDHPDFISNP